MAININSNFKVGSPEPLDDRTVLTKEQMLSIDDAVMPNVYMALEDTTGQLYIYKKSNSVDAETGKFRILEAGGDAVEEVKVLPIELENKVYNIINNDLNIIFNLDDFIESGSGDLFSAYKELSFADYPSGSKISFEYNGHVHSGKVPYPRGDMDIIHGDPATSDYVIIVSGDEENPEIFIAGLALRPMPSEPVPFRIFTESKVYSKGIEIATKEYVDEHGGGDGFMPIEGNTQKDNFNLNVNNFDGEGTGGESIISAQPDALQLKHHYSEENDWMKNTSSQVELKEDNVTITLKDVDDDTSGDWNGKTKITPQEFSIKGYGYDSRSDYASYEFKVGMEGITINGIHDGDGFYLNADTSKTQILHDNSWSDGDYHISNGLKLDSSGVDITAEDYDSDEEDYVTGTLHVGSDKATYKGKEIVTKDDSDTIHITNLNGTGEENEYIQITANGEEGALIRMTGRSGIVTIGGQNIDLNSSLRPTWRDEELATLNDIPDPNEKVNKSGDTMTGTLTLAGTSMPLASGTVTGMTDGTTQLFKDGIAISNPETRNDLGWIRVTGTGETDTVMEIATGDDSGAGETIVFRGYNTSNEVGYQVNVPKDTGTIALTKNVLGTGGGTITGSISRDSGGSWISGRDNATVKQTKHTTNEGSSWNPVVSVKTAEGNWTIGNVGGENLGFSYDTDANYEAGRNTNQVFYLTPNGTFTGTSGAETGYKNISYVTNGLHIPKRGDELYVLREYCQTMTGYSYVKNGNHVSIWLQVPRLRSCHGDSSYYYTLPFNFKRGFIMGLTDPWNVRANRRSMYGGDCSNSIFAGTFTGQYVYMYAENASWDEAQEYGLNGYGYSLNWYRGWDVILIEGEV